MADTQDTNAETPKASNPLADTIRRAVTAHPVLKDQFKTLDISVKDGRVHLTGTVFTRDMHRQLVELLVRIPGAEEIRFDVDPEIRAPMERKGWEGRVPNDGNVYAPSDPRYSNGHLRGPRG